MLKRLSNFSEHRVLDQLHKACQEFGAHVFLKMRVADVIDISKSQSRDVGTYGLMAHFDFVVADENYLPLFALEFDGGGHDDRNDWKKNRLCNEAGLSLFRVNSQTLDRGLEEMSFLTYLVHFWFMAHQFEEMRNSGSIPPDEPFMMWSFIKPDAKHMFDSEYNFLAIAQQKLVELNKQHRFLRTSLDLHKMGFVNFAKETWQFASVACFEIAGEIVYSQSRLDIEVSSEGSLADIPMRSMAIGDYVEGMAQMNLVENVRIFLEGGKHTLSSRQDIDQHIKGMLGAGFYFCRGTLHNALPSWELMRAWSKT